MNGEASCGDREDGVLSRPYVGKGRCYWVVGACGHVSFKVLVLCPDSCKGLSRGGKPAEGGPRGGGVWRIAKFWEGFCFCKAPTKRRAEALG